MNDVNYNDISVVACKYCKSLHIQIDDKNNDICMKCGSVNETNEFNNIEDYRNDIEGSWGI